MCRDGFYLCSVKIIQVVCLLLALQDCGFGYTPWTGGLAVDECSELKVDVSSPSCMGVISCDVDGVEQSIGTDPRRSEWLSVSPGLLEVECRLLEPFKALSSLSECFRFRFSLFTISKPCESMKASTFVLSALLTERIFLEDCASRSTIWCVI